MSDEGKPPEKPTVKMEQVPDWAVKLSMDVKTGFATVDAKIDEVKADVARQIRRPVATRILPRSTFWVGEGYHQDYAHKNPGHYNRYRVGCGRDARIRAVWSGRG